MSGKLLPPSQVYRAAEVAAMLGLNIRQFHYVRERLHLAGMPEPILGGRAMRFPRAAFDRWLADPRRPAAIQAANDAVPTLPGALERARKSLHYEYVVKRKRRKSKAKKIP